MKPSQPSGPVQSRVWYAHTLVVPEQRESKANESAVAAAARQALQSTPQTSHSLQRRRPRRFLELGLLATSAVLLFLVWRQYAQEPTVSGDAVAVVAPDLREDVPAILETGTVEQTVESLPTEVADETRLPPEDSKVPALQEPELPAPSQSRVADFTEVNADLATAETYDAAADLPASEFATAPGASSVEDVGELAPSHTGSEIEVIEVGERNTPPESAAVQDGPPSDANAAGSSNPKRTPSSVVSNARSKPPVSAGKPVHQTKPKKTVKKQSTEVSDFGDCSMPTWAWRAFGFSEEKRRRPC